MANITIEAPLVDGSLMPYIGEEDTCDKAVEIVCGDDLRPPPRSLKITVLTSSGRTVVITIPNTKNSKVRVTVDDDEL